MKISQILFLFFFILTSCGDKDPTERAVFLADFYLSKGQCDKAIKALGDAKDKTGDYYASLSASYACKAGYSELNALFDGGLEDLDAADIETLFTSLAALKTSPEINPDNESYHYLMKAIDVAAEATSDNKASSRTSSFGKSGVNLNSQMFFMSLIGLGKYLNLFGGTDANGAKGLGSGHTCFVKYDPGAIINITGEVKDNSVCESAIALGAAAIIGNPFLGDLTNEDQMYHACEGISLFNNFLDTAKEVIKTSVGDDEDAKKIEDILDLFDNFVIPTPGPPLPDLDSLINSRTISKCTKAYSPKTGITDTQRLPVQLFFIYVFENNLK